MHQNFQKSEDYRILWEYSDKMGQRNGRCGGRPFSVYLEESKISSDFWKF